MSKKSKTAEKEILKVFREHDKKLAFGTSEEALALFDELDAKGLIAPPPPLPLPQIEVYESDEPDFEEDLGEGAETDFQKGLEENQTQKTGQGAPDQSPKTGEAKPPMLQITWQRAVLAMAAVLLPLLVAAYFIGKKQAQHEIAELNSIIESQRTAAERYAAIEEQNRQLSMDTALLKKTIEEQAKKEIALRKSLPPKINRTSPKQREAALLSMLKDFEQKSTAGNNDNPPAKFAQQIAQDFFKKGDYAQAESTLKSWLDKFPDSPQATDTRRNWLIYQAFQPDKRQQFEKNIAEALANPDLDDIEKAKLENLKKIALQ